VGLSLISRSCSRSYDCATCWLPL